jgi:hypothetical protein
VFSLALMSSLLPCIRQGAGNATVQTEYPLVNGEKVRK